MDPGVWLDALNENAPAIQAVSTVVLVVITFVLTRRLVENPYAAKVVPIHITFPNLEGTTIRVRNYGPGSAFVVRFKATVANVDGEWHWDTTALPDEIPPNPKDSHALGMKGLLHHQGDHVIALSWETITGKSRTTYWAHGEDSTPIPLSRLARVRRWFGRLIHRKHFPRA